MNQAKASVKMVSSGQQFEHELVFDTDSGWIKDTAGALTLWIPPWLREGLYLPHNVLVIAARGTTKLNLSRFVHGTEWTECIDPKFRKSRRVEPVDA
ncbi:hypothetical protein DFH06DRAFT_1063805 [Mycena polygramma]|nr:hypothetical protein DFH06DRAFT_1063805 [Mycena polygramma]